MVWTLTVQYCVLCLEAAFLFLNSMWHNSKVQDCVPVRTHHFICTAGIPRIKGYRKGQFSVIYGIHLTLTDNFEGHPSFWRINKTNAALCLRVFPKATYGFTFDVHFPLDKQLSASAMDVSWCLGQSIDMFQKHKGQSDRLQVCCCVK